jgi:hypothetical protein
LIHPADDRIKIAAAHHVPLAADVQAADKSNQPGFKASFDDRVLFSIVPRRTALRAGADD